MVTKSLKVDIIIDAMEQLEKNAGRKASKLFLNDGSKAILDAELLANGQGYDIFDGMEIFIDFTVPDSDFYIV